MRVLVFGASITQGFWDTEGGWVARLRRHYDELAVKNIKNEANYPDIFNLGISADKLEDVLKRFDAEAAARIRKDKKCAIVFGTGTNNAYTEGKTQWSGPGDYESDLQELVNKAKAYTELIMFVELPPCEEDKTTPVSWRDIYYTNERIQIINSLMKKVANENNLTFVSVFDSLKKRTDSGEELYADGLHPNNKGHQIIYELVRPELDRLLG